MEYSRRDFLKEIGKYAALTALSSIPFSCAVEEELTTEEAYPNNWKPEAERTFRKIMRYNREYNEAVMEGSSEKAEMIQEKLLDVYLDPMLQEFPYLQERKLVNRSVPMGEYRVVVEDYRGPVRIDGKLKGVEVKLSVYKGKEKLDINWLPFAESRWIGLQGEDWNLREIIGK